MLERIKRNVFTAPLLVIVIGALAILVGKLLEAISYESAEALFLSYIVAELLVFVLPGIFYVKLKPRGYAVNMNLVSFGFSKLPSVILMFFVMVFGSVLTNLLLSNGTLAELSKDALQMTGGDYLTSPLSILYVSLALAVVPAFAEEFIFRGILLNEYKNYGMLPSVCISAFLFAMLHFDLRLFPLYFLSGLALGFTAYVTRSALSAVGAEFHFYGGRGPGLLSGGGFVFTVSDAHPGRGRTAFRRVCFLRHPFSGKAQKKKQFFPGRPGAFFAHSVAFGGALSAVRLENSAGLTAGARGRFLAPIFG